MKIYQFLHYSKSRFSKLESEMQAKYKQMKPFGYKLKGKNKKIDHK